ncbi:exodeoxyribonuclease VII large subunit [Pseudactinotalea suaedae]|uniref:exodeoxyribonuclease VII large subunit n=1 Tax=Pseudactinotalea suaedae TaxID=1524924 RepID=UPI001F4F2AA7|nr:exodeoxyribonuclease VII large subunit [Pseudactinotalea suaedae]
MTEQPNAERPAASAGPGAARAPLPSKAMETTAENPWPVRVLSSKIVDYIARMPSVWVEGQIVSLNAHNSSNTAWVTLRDTDVDMSMTVTMPKRMLAGIPQVGEGSHVVVQGKPEYWVKRGTLQLSGRSIRAIGVGDLLARVEQLKRLLAAEGLFDRERKRPLPFLPTRVGLICAPAAKARDDVLANARDRWPQVRFEIREVAVQGPSCVGQVVRAIADLDAHPDVDVIVITRGGGAVEDLLPFSNEAMIRAAAAARTPIVSAIGHETDAPLLDLVADYRASTPTDAAKRVVPDIQRERAGLDLARQRLRAVVRHRIDAEQHRIDALRSRPVLVDPTSILEVHTRSLSSARERSRRALTERVRVARGEVDTLRTALRTLSPQATLDRGYAVLRSAAGEVVRSADQVAVGEDLTGLLARGRVHVTVSKTVEADEGAEAVVGFTS